MTAAVHIRWLEDCGATNSQEVGGKCAGLGELIAAGMDVPPGFAVTTVAHEEFLQTHDLRRHEVELLGAIDYEDVAEVAAASAKLRALVEGGDLPATTADSGGDRLRRAVRPRRQGRRPGGGPLERGSGGSGRRQLRRPARDVPVGRRAPTRSSRASAGAGAASSPPRR